MRISSIIKLIDIYTQFQFPFNSSSIIFTMSTPKSATSVMDSSLFNIPNYIATVNFGTSSEHWNNTIVHILVSV